MDIEEELLKVDKAISDDEYIRAKEILYNVLSEVPELGRAHNQLGMLYQKRFGDAEQAEKHYKFAMKFSPNHSGAFVNYIYMLRDYGRVEELEKVIIQAERINNISRAILYDEYGSLYELKKDYKKAIRYYEMAISFTLNNDYIADLKKHVKRCRAKEDYFLGNRFTKALRVLINKD